MLKTALALALLFSSTFLMAACESVSRYQESRTQMNRELISMEQLAQRTNNDLKKDTYILGRVVSDLKSYTGFTKIAADNAIAILEALNKAEKDQGNKPLSEEQIKQLTALAKIFNEKEYQNYFSELNRTRNILLLVIEACTGKEYTSGCRAANPVFADIQQAVDKHKITFAAIYKKLEPYTK